MAAFNPSKTATPRVSQTPAINGVAPKRKQTLRERLRRELTLADICTLCMAAFYTLLGVLYFDKAPNAARNIAANVGFSAILITLVLNEERLHSPWTFPFLILRRFFLLPGILLMYFQAPVYVVLLNPHDQDAALIAIDRALFGVNPTQWIYQFARPALTEFFQICYFSYYIIPIAIAVELFLRRGAEATERLMYYGFLISFAFYLSFLLYFFVPAVGPCFTLHDFSRTRVELPGLWLADVFRNIIDAGWGTMTPNPIATVDRNCMPSGHTMMTLVNIIASHRFRLKLRYVHTFIGAGVIISTVYLRYHYVIDLIAGAVCSIATLWLARRMRLWFRAKGFERA